MGNYQATTSRKSNDLSCVTGLHSAQKIKIKLNLRELFGPISVGACTHGQNSVGAPHPLHPRLLHPWVPQV